MKISRRAGPDHLPVAWCLIPLFRPLDLIINCCHKT
jgi:hypothetical protein